MGLNHNIERFYLLYFTTHTSLICLPCRNEMVKSLPIVYITTLNNCCDMLLQHKSAHMKHDKRFMLIILVRGEGDKGFFPLGLSDNHIVYACQEKKLDTPCNLGLEYKAIKHALTLCCLRVFHYLSFSQSYTSVTMPSPQTAATNI